MKTKLHFIYCLILALCTFPCLATAIEPLPPAAWQLAGIKAALADPDDDIKHLALIKIAALGVKDMQSELIRLMNSDNQRLAFAAIEALAASGAEAELVAGRVMQIIGKNLLARSKEEHWLRQWTRQTTRQSKSIQALLQNGSPKVRIYAFSEYVAMKSDITIVPKVVARLQDSQHRYGSARALAAMGNQIKRYLPDIRARLEDYSFRTEVIRLLVALDAPLEDYKEELLDQLNDITGRSDALVLLSDLGRKAQSLVPRIIELLNQPPSGYSPNYAKSLLSVLGKIDGSGKGPLALKFLRSDDVREGAAGLAFFLAAGAQARALEPQIIPLLHDGDLGIQLNAIKALLAIGADPASYADTVHTLMKHAPTFMDGVWTTLLQALSTLEAEQIRGYVPVVLEQLKQYIGDSEQFSQSVYEFFSKLSHNKIRAEEMAKELGLLLNNTQDTTKLVALTALEAIGVSARSESVSVSLLVEHTNRTISQRAINTLARIQPHNAETAALVVEFILNPARAPVIDSLGPITEMSSILALLEPAYAPDPHKARYRFSEHYLSGGEVDIEFILGLGAGGPENRQAIVDEVQKNTIVLELLAKAWGSSGTNTHVRNALTGQILRLVSGTTWRSRDMPLLKSVVMRFKAAIIDGEDKTLQSAIDAVERKLIVTQPSMAQTLAPKVFALWGAHFVFWCVLLFAYPHSTYVQAGIFWNPLMRRILGLGYVNLLLTSVPALRHLLFAPFRDALIAGASLDEFRQQAYFSGVCVTASHSASHSERPQPIQQAIPEIKGHIYLEGESGLGKSMFLRSLAVNPPRILAYLSATHCAHGVFEGLRNRLPGVANDKGFLESLIYAGAFDIAIDGLNEVSADTRAEIVQFLQRFTKGNILIASQPIAWNPPSSLRRFIIEPLAEDLIESFLTSRSASLAVNAIVTGSEYQTRCRAYLAAVFSQESRQPYDATRRILSNPMDLSVVAQMISQGETPNLFNLQAQQYALVEKDYRRTQVGASFPLDGFAEVAFQMRLRGEFSIPAEGFEEAIACLERHSMIIVRRSSNDAGGMRTTRYFRHDKIMEFFIVHTFLRNKERTIEYLGDVRFQGVYLLLFASLNLEEAKELSSLFVNYAADTKDHRVSDILVKLLRERKAE